VPFRNASVLLSPVLAAEGGSGDLPDTEASCVSCGLTAVSAIQRCKRLAGLVWAAAEGGSGDLHQASCASCGLTAVSAIQKCKRLAVLYVW